MGGSFILYFTNLGAVHPIYFYSATGWRSGPYTFSFFTHPVVSYQSRPLGWFLVREDLNEPNTPGPDASSPKKRYLSFLLHPSNLILSTSWSWSTQLRVGLPYILPIQSPWFLSPSSTVDRWRLHPVCFSSQRTCCGLIQRLGFKNRVLIISFVYVWHNLSREDNNLPENNLKFEPMDLQWWGVWSPGSMLLSNLSPEI